MSIFLVAALAVAGFVYSRGDAIATVILGTDPNLDKAMTTSVVAEAQTPEEDNTEEDPDATVRSEETETRDAPVPETPGNRDTLKDCRHKWKDGVCEICGYVCEHPVHDARYHKCLDCGEVVTHTYISGKCCICGSAPKYSYSVLPDSYYISCEQQGTVETIRYQAELYERGTIVDRTAMVYLPYGYDASKPYNVLILIHGLGGAANSMITRDISYNGKSYVMRNLYDRMIMEKECEPFIGVAINTRLGSYELMYDQIAQEMRNDLLPYIVEHYSTYAKDANVESIVEARQHFGMAGFSMGSIYTYNAGMARAMDVFGNFGAFGGNSEPKYVAKAVNGEAFTDFPIYCLFSGAGVSDGGQGQQFEAYQWIYESTPRLKTGINSFYISPDGSHEWKVWVTEMYNALQIMFQDLENP